MSTSSEILFTEPQLEKGVALAALAACAVFVCVCFQFSAEWYWCLAGVILFLLLGGCIGKQITVDPVARVLREQHRLLRRWVLRDQEYPLSEFDAVVYSSYEEAGDTRRHLMKVGLQHRSGRRKWIRTFPVDCSRRTAEEFAWQLSCETGIEIRQ